MATLNPAQIAILQSDIWFSGLPGPVRAAIIAAAQLKQLSDGEYSHRKDRPGDGWMGILSGAVKICATAPDGKQTALAFLEPGTWFGEISLFDGLPRTHDGIAHGPTELLLVPNHEFRELLKQFPELPLHFLKLQASRLRLLFAAMEDVNVLPLPARLAKQLVNLSHAYGVKEEDGVRINLHLPQEDLAQLLGSSRQRVNVLLSDWVRQGWVSVRYGGVTLHDEIPLKRIASGEAAPVAAVATTY